jgi:hypothetical protein
MASSFEKSVKGGTKIKVRMRLDVQSLPWPEASRAPFGASH